MNQSEGAAMGSSGLWTRTPDSRTMERNLNQNLNTECSRTDRNTPGTAAPQTKCVSVCGFVFMTVALSVRFQGRGKAETLPRLSAISHTDMTMTRSTQHLPNKHAGPGLRRAENQNLKYMRNSD